MPNGIQLKEDRQAQAIKDVIPHAEKTIVNLRKAVEDSPSILGKWKGDVIKRLDNSQSKLALAARSHDPKEISSYFKSGMTELSVASNMLSESMAGAEKIYKNAVIVSAVTLGAVILVEAALTVRYFQAATVAANAAKAAALSAPMARITEVSESIGVSKIPQAQRLAYNMVETVKAIVNRQPADKVERLVEETRTSLHVYADKMGYPTGTIKYVEELLNTTLTIYSR